MRPLRRDAPTIVDACGIGLAIVFVADAIAVASLWGGHAGATVSLVIGTAAAVAAGRIVGSVGRAIVPAVLVAITFGVLVASASSGRHGPLGYGNAAGAFFVQGVVAASTLAVLSSGRAARSVAIVVALALAIAASKDSTAAAAGLACVSACGLALVVGIPVRAVISLAAVLFLGALITTVALGAGYRAGVDGPVVHALSDRRLELWHDSVQLIGDHPLGVGPGRFGVVSPTARRDPDARWAHQEFLQQGVELGWLGLIVTVLFFVWGFARLWVRPAPDVAAALGAAALAALGIHACVDYVIHFPAVPLAAAALVGNAQAVSSRRYRRDRDGPCQEGIEDGRDASGLARASEAG